MGWGEGIRRLSCHRLESRSRVRGFSSEGWSWDPVLLRALKEPVFFQVRLAVELSLWVTVPAGCRVQVCVPSQLLLFCHLHCFIPVPMQKKAGKALDTPETSSAPQPSVSVSNKWSGRDGAFVRLR